MITLSKILCTIQLTHKDLKKKKTILLTGNIFFFTIPVIQIVEMPKEKLPFISFIHQSLFACLPNNFNVLGISILVFKTENPKKL